jgi:uncharacterized BrkB/YihY/UPF0761 family membrane protein
MSVAQVGNDNATYGSIGAVIVLLMWLYLSALITLQGLQWVQAGVRSHRLTNALIVNGHARRSTRH